MTPEILYRTLQSDIREFAWEIRELKKLIYRLERKQEKLKNFIKGENND